ncbi:hypothetical protein VTJ04DRAFT_2504 [Mycothermus thermophilus]|uniref:uncharacterized protein n=1 Tax=Humicola insolens TaxID=85995 RepID=UPI003743675A
MSTQSRLWGTAGHFRATAKRGLHPTGNADAISPIANLVPWVVSAPPWITATAKTRCGKRGAGCGCVLSTRNQYHRLPSHLFRAQLRQVAQINLCNSNSGERNLDGLVALVAKRFNLEASTSSSSSNRSHPRHASTHLSPVASPRARRGPALVPASSPVETSPC